MPRPNAARKAAPAQQKKQAQPDDELDETKQHEAFNEVNDTHSAVNSEPASPSKIAMAGDTTKPNWIRNIAELVGLSRRKTSLEEPQDARAVEEEEELERNESSIREGRTPEPSTPRTQPETAKSTALKSPSRAAGSSANPAKRKRVSNSERQDLYEVPVETATHGSELEEAPPNRPTKRAGRNGKAKAPLTIPKTSKGYTSHQTHRMRGNSAAESEGLEKAVDACRSSPVNRATNTTESEQPKPRKRGRPPKNRNLPSEAVQHDAIPTPKKTQPADHAVAKSTVTANRPGIALQAPGDLDGGISGILLNPSPIKVVRPEVQQAAPTAQHQKSPKPKDRVMTTNGVSEISDDEYELEDDDGNAEANADISDEIEAEDDQGATGQSSNQAQKTPFHPQLIDKMWETSNHVGKKFDIKEQTWSQGGKVQKLLTIPGKRIIRRLNRMISSYENMQNSKESQDKRGFRDAHTEVENIFETLVEETNAILTERFRPGYDTEKVEATLIDLYFNIIPEGIHVLKKAVAVFNIEGSMNTAALQEILRLVDLLYDLANAAVTQPKEIQPRPAGSISYQISQPTRYNLPTIRKLQKLILAELTFREREKERAKEELLRPERERRLREEQEREDSEISRKRDERRRMQGEFWRAVQNNFFPHPWNRVLETDIARLEAARKGKGRQESVELGNPRMRMVEPRRPNSEESRPGSDQGVERVSVFPANNVKVNSSMSSLSKEDTLIFIDCMRYEQGADRYERAAEQIGRSMDEVFAFAKEFQEAMDLQHQEGNFNEARDGWTYSVWVEQE